MARVGSTAAGRYAHMEDGALISKPMFGWAPVAAPVEPFGIRDLFRVGRRRFGLIVSVAIAVFLAALLYIFLQPPEYEARALVMFHPQEASVATPENAQAQPKIDKSAIETQVEILGSRVLMERVADRLGLVNNPDWNPKVEGRSAQFTPAQAIRERAEVVQRLTRAYTIQRQGETYVITIAARARNPNDAARLANTLAQLYLEAQAKSRADRLDHSLSWLAQRTDQLRGELLAKEAAVERFRAEQGLLSSDGVPLSEQQISDAQTAVMTARADLAEREARRAQMRDLIREGRSADIAAGAINSNTVTQLRAREAEVAQRQAELEQRYGELHPALQNIRREREGIRQQIADEVNRIAANAGDEVAVARSRVRALETSLAGARGQLVQNNDSLVRLNQLQREAAAARTVYDNFMEQHHRIARQAELLGTDSEIISNASSPSVPASRSLTMSLLLASGLALALGALAAFIAELLDDRISNADDVERMGAPLLASTPHLGPHQLRSLPRARAHPPGFLAANPMSGFTESYRVLRTTVIQACFDRRRCALAITSALPGEGKTSTSLCLARAAAMSGQRVVVVDCDLRRRSLNHFLAIEPERGLLQVLLREASWRDVVGRDEVSTAHVLPAASSSFTPVDVFESERLHALLSELRDCYDLVVLDCPPILSLAETRAIVREADGALVVARANKTTTHVLRAAVRQVHNAGGNLVGVTLNDVDRKAPGLYSYADPLYFTPSAKGFYST